MKVSGEVAKGYHAVDLSSLNSLPGRLVEGDDGEGWAVMADKTGETRRFELGPRRMRIVPKPHR